jgi:hypothetical protein
MTCKEQELLGRSGGVTAGQELPVRLRYLILQQSRGGYAMFRGVTRTSTLLSGR